MSWVNGARSRVENKCTVEERRLPLRQNNLDLELIFSQSGLQDFACQDIVALKSLQTLKLVMIPMQIMMTSIHFQGSGSTGDHNCLFHYIHPDYSVECSTLPVEI